MGAQSGLKHLTFDIWTCFEFRISNFVFVPDLFFLIL